MYFLDAAGSRLATEDEFSAANLGLMYYRNDLRLGNRSLGVYGLQKDTDYCTITRH